MISRAAAKYSGIKGVKELFIRDVDSDVFMTDQMKRYEQILHTMQTAILSAMAAIGLWLIAWPMNTSLQHWQKA